MLFITRFTLVPALRVLKTILRSLSLTSVSLRANMLGVEDLFELCIGVEWAVREAIL